MASGVTTNSWCSAPMCCATILASGSSLKASSAKPMVKAFTGIDMWRAISAATTLESSPPLRNTPKGTSLSRRRRTESSRWPIKRSRSVFSSSFHFGPKSSDQYLWRSTLPFSITM